MPFSEDDLRQALGRKDPGPEFTRRVMSRLNERNASQKPSLQQKKGTLFSRLPQMRLVPSLAWALVLVLAVGTWIGYQGYEQHEREVKIAQHRQMLAEERARQETILALRLTSEKLNHVLSKVNGALPQDVKIRRERL